MLSYALLQQHTVEQIIDIPVPGRGGGGGWGGLQGFSSGQNSTTRLVEQNVDIQDPRRRPRQGGLPGSHPGQGSTAGVSEQIDDIPIRGGPQGFLPRQGMLQRTVEQIVEIPVPAGGGRVRGCTGTRAHGRRRLVWPRSWRTWISSTSSSSTAVAHGSDDGSRLGQGLLVGSLFLGMVLAWGSYAGSVRPPKKGSG